MSNAQHTKTPWVKVGIRIEAVPRGERHNGGWTVAEFYGPQAHENAAEVVRRVNAHDALVSALERVSEDIGAHDPGQASWMDGALNRVLAALKAAKGES